MKRSKYIKSESIDFLMKERKKKKRKKDRKKEGKKEGKKERKKESCNMRQIQIYISEKNDWKKEKIKT